MFVETNPLVISPQFQPGDNHYFGRYPMRKNHGQGLTWGRLADDLGQGCMAIRPLVSLLALTLKGCPMSQEVGERLTHSPLPHPTSRLDRHVGPAADATTDALADGEEAGAGRLGLDPLLLVGRAVGVLPDVRLDLLLHGVEVGGLDVEALEDTAGEGIHVLRGAGVGIELSRHGSRDGAFLQLPLGLVVGDCRLEGEGAGRLVDEAIRTGDELDGESGHGDWNLSATLIVACCLMRA